MSELRVKPMPRFISSAWRLAPKAVPALLGVVLSGCGGGGGGEPVVSPPVVVNTVAGVASKGPLSGATLCAYAITGGTKGAAIGSCVQSAASGAYTLDLGTYTGPVLLEATGGSYVDEATGTTVTLATPLRSVLSNFAGGSTSAAVTALTELAYQLAAAAAGGLSAANIQSALATVQSNFGVADILTTQPVDALSLPAGAAADQKAYALALATVSQYLKAQPAGATLASAMQTIRVCLAAAAQCGTLASDLAAAMGSFQGAHAGYTGLSLPSTGFGGATGGSSAVVPAVSSFSPATGAVGSTVTITGTNLGHFTPAPVVKFDSSVATVSEATATSITVTVPAGLVAGNHAITLSNVDGTGVVAVGNYAVTAAAGGGGTATGSACLIDGATAALPNAKVCFASLPVPFTCDAAGMRKSASGYLATSGATSYTYTGVDTCPSGVVGGLASALTTTSGASTASTVAGTAIAATTFAGPEVDGAAAVARFYFGSTSTYNGSGITSDGTSLYVADAGHYAIRKVDLTSGAVTTIAGNAAGVDHPAGFPAGFGDGVGTAAYFNGPHGITLDPTHSALYVADSRYVRKIDVASSTVSTLAYVAPKTSATFKNATANATDWFRGATDVATDGVTLYVLDVDIDTGASGGMRLLALDLASNQVRNVAVNLPARSQSLLLDGGTLYVAGGGHVSKIDLTTATLTALAGNDSTVSRDGVGSAASFSLRNEGLATDGASLYISDGTLVRKLVLATGVVTTLAGDTAGYADGVGDAAQFKLLGGLVRVGTALYLTDNLSAIRKLEP